MVVKRKDTALQRKLLVYTPDEIAERGKLAPHDRPAFDRAKLWRDFAIRETPGGGAVLEHKAKGTVACELSPEQLVLYRENPRLQGALANRREVERRPPMGAADREIAPDLQPRSKYMRRQGEVKTAETWPQRGRLLQVVEFLTRHGHLSKSVVYVGVGADKVVPPLADLFPEHHFTIFAADGRTMSRITGVAVFADTLTDDVAETFSSDTLFIGDLPPTTTEAGLAPVMLDQQRWTRIIRPAAALLRLKMPWSKGSSQYLGGALMRPMYEGPTETQAYLVVTDSEADATYEHGVWEDYMFHHNTFTRYHYYEHPIDPVESGLDHCYDCAAEIYVLKEFLAVTRGVDEETADSEVVKLSAYLSRRLSRDREMVLYPE